MNDPDTAVGDAPPLVAVRNGRPRCRSSFADESSVSLPSRLLALTAGCGVGTEGSTGTRGIEFPFTHDLDALRNRLPDGWHVRTTHTDLAELTQWAMETRYPGDWPEAAEPDAIRSEAEARAVHNSVETEFRQRGVVPSRTDGV